jgi:hypothetical protein
MDALGVAWAAASALSAYLTRIASGGVDRARDDAADRLYQLVSSRLQTSPMGASALERLQQQPGEAASQEAIALALADEVGRDPQFGAALAELVGDAPHNVVAIESSSVNQPRRFRLGTGGIVAIVIAAILLLGGITAAVIAPSGSTYPELQGSWQVYDSATGETMVIRITDDNWVWDMVGPIVTDHCGGTVSREKGRTYAFDPDQDTCDRRTLTLDKAGKVLSVDDGGTPFQYVRQ